MPVLVVWFINTTSLNFMEWVLAKEIEVLNVDTKADGCYFYHRWATFLTPTVQLQYVNYINVSVRVSKWYPDLLLSVKVGNLSVVEVSHKTQIKSETLERN